MRKQQLMTFFIPFMIRRAQKVETQPQARDEIPRCFVTEIFDQNDRKLNERETKNEKSAGNSNFSNLILARVTNFMSDMRYVLSS